MLVPKQPGHRIRIATIHATAVAGIVAVPHGFRGLPAEAERTRKLGALYLARAWLTRKTDISDP